MRIAGRLALMILVLLPGLAYAGLALAQVPMGIALVCHDHAELTRQLGASYHEAPVSLGLQPDGSLLELFTSASTGSWTILSTAPDGEACILAVGEHWQWLDVLARRSTV